jgi:mevalonate kinase
MGSGAAVSVALLRSLSAFLGRLLSDEGVSALAFEIEKIHHGTPSGIDNSVVSYRRPVYFVKGQALQFLHLPRDFSLLVADTGVPSPTALSVGDVRGGWQAEPERYEAIFDHIGTIVEQARERLESGQTEALGELMDQNQAALRELDVSSPKLERLIAAARQNEALGAKLCGGGRGGNLIALPAPGAESRITQALQDAGATRVILTTVSSKG